ncbi:hypothetical protein ACQ0QQ_17705 [Lysinibacillus sphaericus]
MLANLMEKTYTWLAFITMLLGLVVGLLFGVTMVIGGEMGASLSVFAGKLMTWGIRLAAIAALAGIVQIYLSKNHTLTIKGEVHDTETEPETSRENLNMIEKKAL